MKKKVSFILFSLDVGGAERQAVAISNYLANNGYEITIVLIENPLIRFSVDPKVKVVFLNDPNNPYLGTDGNISECSLYQTESSYKQGLFRRFSMHLLKIADKKRFVVEDQLIFITKKYAYKIYEYFKDKSDELIFSWMTIPSLSLAIAKRMGLRNRCISVERTDPNTEYPDCHPINTLKKELYPQFSGGVYQTSVQRDYYDYLDSSSRYVIGNSITGVFPDRFEGERKKIIVNFCRLHPVKNIPLLIDAFELLLKDHPEYSLEIFGEGSEKAKLIKYAEQRCVSDKVKFYPYDTNLHERIKDYAMFVSSSDREGISNSMLEALAIGLPTICTDCPGGGARSVINDHVNGLIVPVRDKEKLYRAMKELIEDKALSEKLSLNSTSVKSDYSVNCIGKQWSSVIDEEYNQ